MRYAEGVTRIPAAALSNPDADQVERVAAALRLVQNGMDYFNLQHTHDDTLDKIDPAALDQNVAAYVVFA